MTAAKTKMVLQWPKRPRRARSRVARRRVWTTRCGRYRVVHSIPDYGGLPPCYYATVWKVLEGCWTFVAPNRRHRTLGGARAACERHAKRHAT